MGVVYNYFTFDGVSSRKFNVWISGGGTFDAPERDTDEVEIQAGWKTVFIWLWARAFYTHRQRKWIKLGY